MTREEKIQALATHGATPGERVAAKAALDRTQVKVWVPLHL